MRLCRFRGQDEPQVGLYHEASIIPIAAAASLYAAAIGKQLSLPASSDLLDFLPPDGEGRQSALALGKWVEQSSNEPAKRESLDRISLKTADVELLVPVPRPRKLFLLAGNYAEHIEEGGGIAAERAETFPYVFMKPPSTTLTDPGKSLRIPAISPAAIDWELELAVVIGRRAKGVSEAEALRYVAGYTVINDISNRVFRPNPRRKKRDKDVFFDWLHGKWHDSFCPCGPCVVPADAIDDPQALELTLRLNGDVRQHSSTARQIFPVAAVIEFIASFVTLEPGDIISTGTPSGVGHTKGTYLKPGDLLEASIEKIGTLVTPVVAE